MNVTDRLVEFAVELPVKPVVGAMRRTAEGWKTVEEIERKRTASSAARKLRVGASGNVVFGGQNFNLSCDDTAILLGVGDGVSKRAFGLMGSPEEIALQKRLKQLGVVDSESPEIKEILAQHTQKRVPLEAPIPTHPTAANPNPNAPGVAYNRYPQGRWTRR